MLNIMFSDWISAAPWVIHGGTDEAQGSRSKPPVTVSASEQNDDVSFASLKLPIKHDRFHTSSRDWSLVIRG
jgi:hypothetical protein